MGSDYILSDDKKALSAEVLRHKILSFESNCGEVAQSEKLAQIAKLQQVIREYTAKSKGESALLQSKLDQSQSETLAIRQQVFSCI